MNENPSRKGWRVENAQRSSMMHGDVRYVVIPSTTHQWMKKPDSWMVFGYMPSTSGVLYPGASLRLGPFPTKRKAQEAAELKVFGPLGLLAREGTAKKNG